MAAPLKEGLDYFPCDTHFDYKIELIEAQYGLLGYGIIIKLFQMIYGSHGYYCAWSDKFAVLFAGKQCMLSNAKDYIGGKNGVELVWAVVESAFDAELLDKGMFDKYGILTSRGIQKRYFEAIKRRRANNVKREYLLIELNAVSDNDSNNGVNVCDNSQNADNNEQSKVKESKGKENKVKESRAEESKAEESKANAGGRNESIADESIYGETEEKEFSLPPLPPEKISFLNKIFKEYALRIEPLSSYREKDIREWLEKVDADVILYAIKEADESGRKSWKYVNAVLRDHYNAGRTTMEAVERNNKEFRSRGFERRSCSDGGFERRSCSDGGFDGRSRINGGFTEESYARDTRKNSARGRFSDRDTHIYQPDGMDYNEIIRIMNEKY